MNKTVFMLDITTPVKTLSVEVDENFKKGNPIVVVGRLQTQHLVNSKDGRTTKIYEIAATSVDFVPKAKEKPAEEFTEEEFPF